MMASIKTRTRFAALRTIRKVQSGFRVVLGKAFLS
jgi:hypothetical protein